MSTGGVVGQSFYFQLPNMSIKVLYFASLKDIAGRDCDELQTGESLTPREIWRMLHPGIAMPDAVLAAVNQEYASLDGTVRDGDELAFFPPVTGG